jgi:hypothetical protein
MGKASPARKERLVTCQTTARNTFAQTVQHFVPPDGRNPGYAFLILEICQRGFGLCGHFVFKTPAQGE